MAVAIDNTGASVGSAAGVSSLDITGFTIGSISNGLLFLGISYFNTTNLTFDTVNSKWNSSQTFTQLDTDADTTHESGTRRTIIGYIKAPTAATGTIHVVLSGVASEWVTGATSWSGVDQTTPFGTVSKSNSTGGAAASDSITLTSVASGNQAVDVLCVDAAATSTLSTANQTARYRQQAAVNTTEGDHQSAAGAGSNITMTWTFANGSSFFSHMAVVINQVSAGFTPKFRKTLSGYGSGVGKRQLQGGLSGKSFIKRNHIYVPSNYDKLIEIAA